MTDDDLISDHEMTVRAHNAIRREMERLGIVGFWDANATVGQMREAIRRIGGERGVMNLPNVGKLTAKEIMAFMPPEPMTEREAELRDLVQSMILALEARAICAGKYRRALRRIVQ